MHKSHSLPAQQSSDVQLQSAAPAKLLPTSKRGQSTAAAAAAVHQLSEPIDPVLAVPEFALEPGLGLLSDAKLRQRGQSSLGSSDVTGFALRAKSHERSADDLTGGCHTGSAVRSAKFASELGSDDEELRAAQQLLPELRLSCECQLPGGPSQSSGSTMCPAYGPAVHADATQQSNAKLPANVAALQPSADGHWDQSLGQPVRAAVQPVQPPGLGESSEWNDCDANGCTVSANVTQVLAASEQQRGETSFERDDRLPASESSSVHSDELRASKWGSSSRQSNGTDEAGCQSDVQSAEELQQDPRVHSQLSAAMQLEPLASVWRVLVPMGLRSVLQRQPFAGDPVQGHKSIAARLTGEIAAGHETGLVQEDARVRAAVQKLVRGSSARD